MSVKMGLLAILDQGACYGYQLRNEFDRRTGATWPLNVGQIYNTLERLEREGLVTRRESDADGHIVYEITVEGRAAVAGWLGSAVERQEGTRDELAIKLAIAATLPGVDVVSVIQVQRRASLQSLQSLNRAKYAADDPDDAEELAWQLVIDSLIFSTEAEVRWLDHTEQRLALLPRHTMGLDLDREPRKRGRPARAKSETETKR